MIVTHEVLPPPGIERERYARAVHTENLRKAAQKIAGRRTVRVKQDPERGVYVARAGSVRAEWMTEPGALRRLIKALREDALSDGIWRS